MKDIVKAACALHNYLQCSMVHSEDTQDIEKLSETQFLHLRGDRSRNSSAAFRMRNNLTEYFNNWGAVPWQYQ